MLRRPPQSVVLAIASAGVVGLEAIAVGVWCAKLLRDGETVLPSATFVLCVLIVGGICSFIRGALLQRPYVRMTALGWTMPIAICLAVFVMLLGLMAILLSARPAALPLLAFVLVVVLPIATISGALLRSSARAWFDAGAARERRSRRP